MIGEEYSTVIEPHKGLNPFNWREFWRYRELFFILVWRDIKVRYKQTFLGVAWAIFQPFVSMIVFTLFFGVLVKVPSDNLPYPIFVYAGLLPWTLFSNGLSRGSMSVLNETNMISKTYFPRLIIPISSFGAGMVDFVISFFIMAVMMFYYGIIPTLSILVFPLLIFITLIASIGVSVILAALTVSYRDVKYISPFLIQIWMYATPVIYPVSVVPEKWRWVLSLNPMCGVIDGCRSALFGKTFYWNNLLLSALISFLLFIVGLIYFKNVEYRFADII
jgi:lipopolysaccharide transport system permease protein